ncbi:MAG: hypothetical protein AB1469_03130 [Pseudomonadota bacterium]
MNTLPTDREILKYIYKMYEPSYPGKEPGQDRGKNDPYMPINIHDVAARIGCTPEMIFGRLYYHLNAKYRYSHNDTWVNLFSISVGSERHCVNFPYLAAILAEKNLEHKQQLWSLSIAIIALALSIASIVVQLITTK